jgi:hypothetical protein
MPRNSDAHPSSCREESVGLTREIGEFIAGMTFEKAPEKAVPIVLTGFTDCVGVMLAGLREPVAVIVAKWVGFSGPMKQLADFGKTGLAAPDLGSPISAR